mgnify:CR=1 FL=1
MTGGLLFKFQDKFGKMTVIIRIGRGSGWLLLTEQALFELNKQNFRC